MADREKMSIRGDVWDEIQRLVSEAKANGAGLNDTDIAEAILALVPDSGLAPDAIREELTRFSDADDR